MKLEDGKYAIVQELPECSMHKLHGARGVMAHYDARLKNDTWAYLCYSCWIEYSVGRLGIGFGQRLYLPNEIEE